MYKAIPYKIGIIGAPGAGKTRLLRPLLNEFSREGTKANAIGPALSQMRRVRDGKDPLPTRPELDLKGKLKTEVLYVKTSRKDSLLHIEFRALPGEILDLATDEHQQNERLRFLKGCSLQIVVINPFQCMDRESKMEYIVKLAISIENPPKGEETISAFSVMKACQMIGGKEFPWDNPPAGTEETQLTKKQLEELKGLKKQRLKERITFRLQDNGAKVKHTFEYQQAAATDKALHQALSEEARNFLFAETQNDPLANYAPMIQGEIENRSEAGIPCLLIYSHLDILNRIGESVDKWRNKIINNPHFFNIQNEIDGKKIKGIFMPNFFIINDNNEVVDNARRDSDTDEFLRELKNNIGNIGLGVRRRLKHCLVINLAVALGTIGLWTAPYRDPEEFIIFSALSALLSLLHLATCVILGPFTFCWQIALLPPAGWAAIFAFVINNLNGPIYSIDKGWFHSIDEDWFHSIDKGWFHAVFLLQTLICIFSGAYSEDDGASILTNRRRTTGP